MHARTIHRARRCAAAAAAVVALAAAALAPAGAAGREGDRSVVALNILPAGQGHHLNAADLALHLAEIQTPDELTDQLGMYEKLVRKAPDLTAADFAELFKDATFGVKPGDAGRTYSPRSDVTIVRDLSFDVPHVFGSTRSGTMFGAGYASAEDRLFMMDVLRHLSRGRLSELLGASDSNLAADRAQRLVADYTEDELVAMANRVAGLDPVLGPLAAVDLASFVDGVNAFIAQVVADPVRLPAEYPALQLVPRPWKVTDSVALSTLIGGTFSVGGGGQLANAALLSALEADHPPATARAIFDDFRFANDPESPTSTPDTFNYNTGLGPPQEAAVARPDAPSQLIFSAAAMPATVDGPFGPIALLAPGGASNALLVDKDLADEGRPIAVFGPQVGYYSPEILMELDLHGPGVHARGAAFPGISLYVLLGRGAGYGWSATTAIGDHTDIRAVELCNLNGSPATLSSAGYRRDGLCNAMYRRTDSWVAKPSAASLPAEGGVSNSPLVSFTTERVHLGDPDAPLAGIEGLAIGPDWAIVVARGTVGGKPVAFVRQRASYGIEVDATLAFTKAHDPAMIGDIQDLIDGFADFFSFSFNWHFVDADDVAFFTTGRYPRMADGVDQDLPFWGDSRWDWTGFLSKAEHPQDLDPASGYIVNWNNKQAPGFRAADDWWAYGPVGRVKLLDDGVQAAMAGDGTVSTVEVVQAMGIAATRDVRGVYTLPHVLSVVGTSGLTVAQADAVAALSLWVSDGAHRRDRDFDGDYEHADAVALIDGLWKVGPVNDADTTAEGAPLLEAMFAPTLQSGFAKVPLLHDDSAGPGGSAYLVGWYGQVNKDLRQILGLNPAGAFSRTYCGAGVLAACRTALLAALDRAIDQVARFKAEHGTDWDEELKNRDAIQFSAVGVPELPAMHWQNRPTFQQVLEFE